MNGKLKMATSAAAILLLLGGCQKKAGGQVVAVVNGEEITQQELNAELQGVSVPPGADKNKIIAQILQRIVDRKLLVQEAKSQGLDQSPAYLDQVRRAQDTIIVDLLAGKLSKTMSLPDGGAVSSFIAANPTRFAERKRYTLDQIIFPRPTDPAIVKELEPAASLDAVAAILSSRNIQFKRRKVPADTITLDPAVVGRIASTPTGKPILIPEQGFLSASVVIATEAVPTPDDEAKPLAAKFIRDKSLSDAMRRELEKDRATAKIEYQPGFAPPGTSAVAKP